MKNLIKLLFIGMSLSPLILCAQQTKTPSLLKSYSQLPKRIIIFGQDNVCVTDSQFDLVLIGFSQLNMVNSQLQLCDSIILQKNIQTRYLNAKITNLELQKIIAKEIIVVERELTKKEKRKLWWKNQKDKLVIGGLSIIAAAESVLLVYVITK